jgi:hypothetical protein
MIKDWHAMCSISSMRPECKQIRFRSEIELGAYEIADFLHDRGQPAVDLYGTRGQLRRLSSKGLSLGCCSGSLC